MLPLFATCDRWDVGGLSTEWHPATGQLTVFVYDGHEGGAGFAERAFAVAASLAAGHQRSHRILPMRNGLPFLHPVPQMRQRQQPPLKGGRSNPPRHSPGESGLTTRKAREPSACNPRQPGRGGVPHDRGAPGGRPPGQILRPTAKVAESHRARKGGGPRRGGERGPRTVRPWGGEPAPFYKEAYPLTRLRTATGWQPRTRATELQHICPDREQTFRPNVRPKRIFFARRPRLRRRVRRDGRQHRLTECKRGH